MIRIEHPGTDRSEGTMRHAYLIRTALAVTVLSVAPMDPSRLVAQTVDLQSVTTRLEREVSKILDETGIPSISIAIIRDGDVAWTGAYGWSNVAARVPATPDTYYSTGSTFKFVTATAIMQLVEKGELELDTPLNALIPDSLHIEGADDVTLRHMLSHHSGLQGPVGIVPLWSRTAPRTVETLLAGTRRIGPPGTTYRYCNECYAFAGWMIAKTAGRTYDAYVNNNILRPLGIEVDAPSVPSPTVVERLALPYNTLDNEPVPAAQVRYDVFAAGDIYLRASDMARFVAAQLGDGEYRGARILSAESTHEMRRQQFDGRAYGLGVGLASQSGHSLISHGGSIPGFNSLMVAEPASGLGIYMMSNSGQASPALGALARLTMRLLWGEDPEPLASFATEVRTSIELDTDVFDALVGVYRLSDAFAITVSREGSRFYIQATDQPRLEIFAESETEFFLRAVEASMTFGRDAADGPVTHLILHQGGANQRMNRVR
jgi:D-alanyl-D-alanine-carboxypeptidase/D-alanyl-D-alanine-endopeptidase